MICVVYVITLILNYLIISVFNKSILIFCNYRILIFYLGKTDFNRGLFSVHFLHDVL